MGGSSAAAPQQPRATPDSALGELRPAEAHADLLVVEGDEDGIAATYPMRQHAVRALSAGKWRLADADAEHGDEEHGPAPLLACSGSLASDFADAT